MSPKMKSAFKDFITEIQRLSHSCIHQCGEDQVKAVFKTGNELQIIIDEEHEFPSRNKYPRGVCSVCSQIKPVSQCGIWPHRNPEGYGQCSGSSKSPKSRL